jgi:5-methyltetrahydrofolate--homocysteine methyltransferase/ATP-dependent helicase HrpA
MVQLRIERGSKHSLGATAAIKDKARQLRKRMTDPEKMLWSRIRNEKLNGMYFRRQHPYGIYVLDFFCFESNLVIEIDGLIHLRHRDYDNERTKYLESSGLKVIRFTNTEIEDKIEWVLEVIMKAVDPFPPGGNKKGGHSIKTDAPNHVEST